MALPCWAKEPTVGPNDGKAVESIAPVETPVLDAVEKMPDTTLPQSLEKSGDYAASLLEWRRILNQLHGPDRLNGLLATARLQQKLGNDSGALITLRTAQTEYATDDRAPEILYYISNLTTGDERTQLLGLINTRFAQTPWGQSALMQAVWQEAGTTGKISQTYDLPNAITLQKRLALLRVEAKARFTTAFAFSIIPGGGHLFLKDYATGGILLMFWAVLFLAFLSACRHRHYAYALVWAFPMAALWLNSPGLTIALAKQQAADQREAALTSWKDLQPPPIPANK